MQLNPAASDGGFFIAKLPENCTNPLFTTGQPRIAVKLIVYHAEIKPGQEPITGNAVSFIYKTSFGRNNTRARARSSGPFGLGPISRGGVLQAREDGGCPRAPDQPARQNAG